MSKKIDESSLVVRNFPASFTEDEIREFLQMFDPAQVDIFVENHAAVVEFPNKEHARNILTLLHQEILDENLLFVEFASNNRNQQRIQFLKTSDSMPVQNETTEPDKITEEIGETIKKLYATADNLNLMQPPPPYLHYEYPKVNRDIIDAIGIAIECMPKFYVQVLHLMNRMNLEPPFIPGDKRLIYESSMTKVQYATASTQTDEIIWQHFVHNKRKLVETDESELESSADDEINLSKPKRKKLTENNSNWPDLLKQKQRNLLKMQRIQKQLESTEKPAGVQTSQQTVGDAFELDLNRVKMSGIKIVVPEKLESTTKSDESVVQLKINEITNNQKLTTSINVDANSLAESVDRLEVTKSDHIWTDSELMENRIPADQLKGHSMFQNYKPGDVSNRLYIKNIAKEVTESDLRSIYNRYLEKHCNGHGNIRSIEIRLMSTGRMKGQAFITFDGPYLNCDDDDDDDDDDDKRTANLTKKCQMIVKALRETNGLILKGKPLVVSYGKKK